MNRILILILALLAAGCAPATVVKENNELGISSLVSIDGKELLPNGRLKGPTLFVILSFSCPHCQEAAGRISDWIIPEIDSGRFNVIGIGRDHDAEDLKLWREGLNIGFDLVADPRRELADRFMQQDADVPAYIFFDQSGAVAFRYEGWSLETGQALLGDIRFLLDNRRYVNKSRLLDEVLVLTRVDASIDGLSVNISEGFGANTDKIPEGLLLALQKNSEDNLDVESMKSGIRRMMISRLDYTALNDMRNWEKSPLGTKLGEMAGRALKPDFTREHEAYVKRIDSDDPPRLRVELLARLDQLSGSSELMTHIGLVTAIGFMSVMDSLKPREEQAGFDNIRNFVMSRRDGLAANLRGATVVLLMHIYQDASDSELKRLVDFYETRSGQMYSRAVVASLAQLLNEYNANVVKGLPPIMEQYRNVTGI